MTRVQVKPELLRCACERPRIHEFEPSVCLPRVMAWERGAKQPTVKQLEEFAKATQTALGYFFLPEPPVERLPIEDFQTVAEEVARTSSDMLESIFAMQRPQTLLREDRCDADGETLKFVGSPRLVVEQCEKFRLRLDRQFERIFEAEVKRIESKRTKKTMVEP